MQTFLLVSMIGGLFITAVSALASDISLDFGSDTSGSTMTVAIGTLFGLGGAAGLITNGLGTGLVMTIIIAVITGFIGAFAVSKLVAFMIENSSDGGESSSMDTIGQVVEAPSQASSGTVGELWAKIGKPPISTRFYYKAENNVKKGDKLKIIGVDLEKNLLTVEDLTENDRLEQEARDHENATPVEQSIESTLPN